LDIENNPNWSEEKNYVVALFTNGRKEKSDWFRKKKSQLRRITTKGRSARVKKGGPKSKLNAEEH